MSVSKLEAIEQSFLDAVDRLQLASELLHKETQELVKRAKKASAVGTGFVIALAKPKDGDITHGTVAIRHREFQALVQEIEALRKTARTLKHEEDAAKLAAKKPAAEKKASADKKKSATKK